MGNKQRNVRLLALMLAALCLFAWAAASPALEGLEHECAGEQCFLCLCLSLGQSLADMLLLPASLCFAVSFVVRCGIHHPNAIVPAAWTPVCLKVKLSN